MNLAVSPAHTATPITTFPSAASTLSTPSGGPAKLITARFSAMLWAGPGEIRGTPAARGALEISAGAGILPPCRFTSSSAKSAADRVKSWFAPRIGRAPPARIAAPRSCRKSSRCSPRRRAVPPSPPLAAPSRNPAAVAAADAPTRISAGTRGPSAPASVQAQICCTSACSRLSKAQVGAWALS